MWSLFPELLGPMIIAFVLGSLLAWAVIGIVLPKRPVAPAAEPGAQSPPTRGR